MLQGAHAGWGLFSARGQFSARSATANVEAFIGVGAGVWDFTHGDYVTPHALVHFGVPVWKGAEQRALFLVGEGRVFFDQISDVDSNYMFWGGLRFRF